MESTSIYSSACECFHHRAEDLNSVGKSDLKGICLIEKSSEPVLFPGVLRSNLALGRCNSSPATITTTQDGEDRRLLEILTNALLWHAISSYGSPDAEVSNFTLSYGQKQLLCLKRAVVHKSSKSILILDATTSAVNNETQRSTVNILETESASHTIICIVHRLHIVRGFNNVIVLGNGQTVEIGPPNELLAKERGNFRRLWDTKG